MKEWTKESTISKFDVANLTSTGQTLIGNLRGRFSVHIRGTWGATTVLKIQGSLNGVNYDDIVDLEYSSNILDNIELNAKCQIDLVVGGTTDLEFHLIQIDNSYSHR